ncbi:hypothetical protein BC831DRAFT_470383 [Entophlyctis helioformis]|nr:hypothetical protein BC831DRAFT_470383 [Entophlyctis helioformis]
MSILLTYDPYFEIDRPRFDHPLEYMAVTASALAIALSIYITATYIRSIYHNGPTHVLRLGLASSAVLSSSLVLGVVVVYCRVPYVVEMVFDILLVVRVPLFNFLYLGVMQSLQSSQLVRPSVVHWAKVFVISYTAVSGTPILARRIIMYHPDVYWANMWLACGSLVFFTCLITFDAAVGIWVVRIVTIVRERTTQILKYDVGSNKDSSGNSSGNSCNVESSVPYNSQDQSFQDDDQDVSIDTTTFHGASHNMINETRTDKGAAPIKQKPRMTVKKRLAHLTQRRQRDWQSALTIIHGFIVFFFAFDILGVYLLFATLVTYGDHGTPERRRSTAYGQIFMAVIAVHHMAASVLFRELKSLLDTPIVDPNATATDETGDDKSSSVAVVLSRIVTASVSTAALHK